MPPLRSIQSRTAKKAARAAQPRPKSAQPSNQRTGCPCRVCQHGASAGSHRLEEPGLVGAGPQSTVLGGLSMRDLRSVVAQVRRTVTAEDNVAEPAIPGVIKTHWRAADLAEEFAVTAQSRKLRAPRHLRARPRARGAGQRRCRPDFTRPNPSPQRSTWQRQSGGQRMDRRQSIRLRLRA